MAQDQHSFTDWVLELPVRVFIWGLTLIIILIWSIAMALLLIYIHFFR